MTGLAATFAEAWAEVRVHKLRVILSLVGVFLAVFGMTAVTAAGDIGRQVVAEAAERAGGRPVTLQVQAFPQFGLPDQDLVDTAYAALVKRYQVEWSSVVLQTMTTVRFPGGSRFVQATAVDPAYGTIHRITPAQGRWFAPADIERLGPVLVVNTTFLAELGDFDAVRPLTVTLGGATPVVATVIGVVDDDNPDPATFVLNAAADRWGIGGAAADLGPPLLEVWVPSGTAETMRARAESDLRAVLPGYDVQVFRADSSGSLRTLDLALSYGVRAIGYFALFLGGIGVLNVGLVVVRQRIREIGVRRSFGATSGRVFAAVLLESVVATAVAGALAVACAVALVLNLPYERLLGTGLTLDDVPAFPVRAAVEGFLAATGIGAIAGVVPAIVAVRAKVIDAIRF